MAAPVHCMPPLSSKTLSSAESGNLRSRSPDRAASGRVDTFGLCRGGSHPHPAPPKTGCPQLRPLLLRQGRRHRISHLMLDNCASRRGEAPWLSGWQEIHRRTGVAGGGGAPRGRREGCEILQSPQPSRPRLRWRLGDAPRGIQGRNVANVGRASGRLQHVWEKKVAVGDRSVTCSDLAGSLNDSAFMFGTNPVRASDARI